MDAPTTIQGLLLIIAALTGAGSAFVKAAVDLVKAATPAWPDYTRPLAAYLISVAVCALMLAAVALPLGSLFIALSLLSAIPMAGGAVLLTEAHKAAREVAK